jgi:transcriptional regulator with PAS, ATPase and Fis domain
LDHSNLKIPAPIFYQTKAISDGDRSLTEEELEYSDDQAYCTYAAGDEAMGPALTVWWLKEDDIPDLIRIENESSIRVLPRYAPYYDGLCDSMVHYCYEHRLELDLVASEFIENIEPFFVKLQKDVNPWQKSIGENYELLSILSTSHRDPKAAYMEYLEKASIPVPETVLDEHVERPEQEGTPRLERTQEEWLEQKGIAIPDALEEKVDIRDHQRPSGPEDWPSYERMSEKIWSRFNDYHVQDLLSRMSTKLINQYMELAARTDFNPELAWKLKDQYLQDLYKAVMSPGATMLFRQELDDEELKEVKEAEARFPGVRIISIDHEINRIKIDISKMARVEKKNVSFLLLGESGTGKELFAKAIYESSGRKGRYIVSDCGAKSDELFESQLFGHVKGAFTGAIRNKKGDFELADGGTIFLDEIGNLTGALQPKMLRVLREREIQPLGAEYTKKVDVKIVLATNKDLAKMVEDGRFMRDLYQRFKRPQFLIPPLRERKKDVPALVEHFLEKHDVERENDPSMASIQMTPEGMRALTRYEWKDGNVAELEKVIEEIMLRRAGSKDRRDITVADLPLEISQMKKNDGEESEPEKVLRGNPKATEEQIAAALKRTNNNKSAAAKELGYSIRHFRRLCNTPSHRRARNHPV